MSDTTTLSLPERISQSIKTANDLLSESNQKLSQYEADDSQAAPVVDRALEKLASIQIHGQPVLPMERKDSIREAMNTKHGMAELFDQLVDILDKHKPEPKVASDLGAPARRQPVEPPREIRSFADLRSKNIRM